MQTQLNHSGHAIKLNGEFTPRTYAMEIISQETIGTRTTYNGVGQNFTIVFKGLNGEGLLKFKLKNHRRFFINERYNIVTKLSKAQEIALLVAALNDELDVEVTENFQLVSVTNTEQIRKKWVGLRASLLKVSPDLSSTIKKFDRQLNDDSIQTIFLKDIFYNFFFSNIFYQDFKENPVLEAPFLLTNAINDVDVPIRIQKTFNKEKYVFDKIAIELNANIAGESAMEKAKLKDFFNKIANSSDVPYTLKFNYTGLYSIKPSVGLVTQGNLNYGFEVKNLYKKKTAINFNLEKDER